uniref:Ovule protein n=1 Tax=Rodentolepis nana TaxID=102285 RepID=A0A0R3TKQ3_RODNA
LALGIPFSRLSIPSVISPSSNDHHHTPAAVSHDKLDPDFRSTETPSLIGDAIVLHIALFICCFLPTNDQHLNGTPTLSFHWL